MPNHYSALKRTRQTKRRTAINRTNRGSFRSSLRSIRKTLSTGAREKIQPQLPEALSRIDKAVQKGLIHKNTAGRLKSRLMARFNALPATTPQ
jgi:small subunit ribosomal protein S20